MRNLSFLSQLVICFAFIGIIFSSCTTRQEDQGTKQGSKKIETIDGNYSFEDNSILFEISINGDKWFGKTTIISGFGSDYDNQQATYENGTMSGNDLYESRGIVQVGYVDGDYIHTSVGNRRITLQKE